VTMINSYGAMTDDSETTTDDPEMTTDDPEMTTDDPDAFNEKDDTKSFVDGMNKLMFLDFDHELMKGKTGDSAKTVEAEKLKMEKQLIEHLTRISNYYKMDLDENKWKSTAYYILACYHYLGRGRTFCLSHMQKTIKSFVEPEGEETVVDTEGFNPTPEAFAEFNKNTMLHVAYAIQHGKGLDTANDDGAIAWYDLLIIFTCTTL